MTDSIEYDLLRDAVARALAEAWSAATPLELYSEGDRVAALWRVLAEARPALPRAPSISA